MSSYSRRAHPYSLPKDFELRRYTTPTGPREPRQVARDVKVVPVTSLLNPVPSTSKRAKIRYLKRDDYLVTGSPFIDMTNFARFPEGKTPAKSQDATDIYFQDVREMPFGEQPQLKTHGFAVELDAPVTYWEEFEYNDDPHNVLLGRCDQLKNFMMSRLSLEACMVTSVEAWCGPPDHSRISRADVPGYHHPLHQPYGDKLGLVGHDELEKQWPEVYGIRRPGDHFSILNYWAPTQQAGNDRVTDWPLALCDPRSVDEKRDFELGEIQRGSEITRTHFVYHNPAHRWYYLSNQHVTQAWLRVLWDSNNHLPQSTLATTFDTAAGQCNRLALEYKVYVKWRD